MPTGIATFILPPLAMGKPIDNRTPLLKVGRAFVKLECLRPSGGFEDRLLRLWSPPPQAEALAVGAQGAALAAAAWARAHGVRLRQIVWGPLTHEARKTLEIWGLPFEHVAERPEIAGSLPPLDGDEAVPHAASLVTEIIDQLQNATIPLVAPAGARAALLAWKGAAIAVTGPADLPDFTARDLRGVQLREVSRDFAVEARRRLARQHGLLVSHASAAAIAVAEEVGGVALASATGEREFSLDREAP